MTYEYSWWAEDIINRATSLTTALDTLKQSQQWRYSQATVFDSLYDGVDYRYNGNLGGGPGGLGNTRPHMPPISYNALRVVGDTMQSKLVEATPKIKFLTNDGTWADRKKAEILERLTDAEFYRCKVPTHLSKMYGYALRHGNGYLKFIEENGKVAVECPHPAEMFADEAETFSGPARQLYQERFCSREVLIALYPEKEEEIRSASVVSDIQYHYFTMHVGEIVRVVEGWHLRSGPDEKDGRHVIAVDSGVLFEEDWERDDFPFVVFRLFERSRGFYAIGLVERQLELQTMLNKMIRRRYASIHMLCAPYVLVEAGSKVVKEHFNTDIGSILTFTGVKPELVVNEPVSTAIDNSINQLIQWMMQDAGINDLEATGDIPKGLDSAPSIESYNTTTGLRHISLLRRMQDVVVEVGEQILETIREISAEGGDYETNGMFKGHTQVIKWSEIDLERDSYVIQLAPTNTLPDSPAGRNAAVIRMVQAGLLTQPQGLKALASPDIEAITADVAARDDDLDWTIYQMTKPKGARYMAPEQFQDLAAGLQKVTNAYLRERDNEAPEEIQQNLRRWILDASGLIEAQKAQLQAQQGLEQQAQMSAGPSGALAGPNPGSPGALPGGPGGGIPTGAPAGPPGLPSAPSAPTTDGAGPPIPNK